MPQRKLRNNKEEKPNSTLRRSPRFLQANRTDAKSAGNPKTSPRKYRHFDSNSTPLGSLIEKSQKKNSQEGVRRSTRLKTSRESSGRLRSSVRSDGGVDACKTGKSLDFEKHYVVEKRVTRSSVRGSSKCVINLPRDCVSDEDSAERVSILSKERTVEVGVNLYKQCTGNIEKRVTRSASRTKINVEKVNDAPTKTRDTNVLTDVGNPKRSTTLCKLYASESKCNTKKGIEGKNCEQKMQVGEKRKRVQVEKKCGIVQGWTKEEELTLQRAYFTAKPTPQFWKKVARMVPGKSAEECFDRIHSDHLTPPQPRTRSAAHRNKASFLSFSASKLLSSVETKTKRLRPSKRKSLVAQKMVRQILQKQHNEDQDCEADLFAILEPTMDTLSLNFQESSPFSSPAPNQGAGILTRCWETSSSSHKKNLSPLNSSYKAAFVSPPVLKRIKNKALHERYIDQLHFRDANRKAKSFSKAESTHGKNDKKTGHLNVTSVKTAKDALVFDAQDAINQFCSVRSGMLNNDIDDNSSQSDMGEGEDDL